MAPPDQLVIGNPLQGFSGRSQAHVPVLPVKGPHGFSALIYQCKLNVDWDGAATAYGLDRTDTAGQKFPLQKNLKPIEAHANGGSLLNARAQNDRHWVGVFAATEREARDILRRHYPGFAALKPAEQNSIFNQFLDTREHTPFGSLKDVNGRFPVVQLPQLGGTAPGYYVSICNAHTGATNDAWDQRRYVDASMVCYAALPKLPAVRLGDCGVVIRPKTGDYATFYFGDAGAGHHLGECSGAVKDAVAPERNGEDDNFAFIVFPGSGGGSAVGLDKLTVDKITIGQFIKIRNTDDALARLIARHDPYRYFVGSAIGVLGGPSIQTEAMLKALETVNKP